MVSGEPREKANSIAFARNLPQPYLRSSELGQNGADNLVCAPILADRIVCITNSHLEAFAEVKLSADGIVDEKIFCAFAFHTTIENQISAVYDGESLTHIVIRDHDG